MSGLSKRIMAAGNFPPSALSSYLGGLESFGAGASGFRLKAPGAHASDALKTPRVSGDHTARVPPVPIPNTEVKPRWADGTARAGAWEIR